LVILFFCNFCPVALARPHAHFEAAARFPSSWLLGYFQDAPSDSQKPAPPVEPQAPHPNPPAAKESVQDREAMVRDTIEKPRDGRRPVADAAVLAAMRAVPRHAFVPQRLRGSAHADSPLPIGHGQTISQPYIVALMTELLELKPDSKVLEIGTGSGYQAAVLAHLTPHVFTIEIIKPLHEAALKALREQGYTCVRCRHADGYFGWPEEAPFDAIIVTAAAGHLPPPLWDQLKPGGRIVIPIGGPNEVQRLIVVDKKPDGTRESKTIIAVQFVPLTREVRNGG
jgi:protein-L-isoaspartate(D-aspartate) O-methyltransferase